MFYSMAFRIKHCTTDLPYCSIKNKIQLYVSFCLFVNQVFFSYASHKKILNINKRGGRCFQRFKQSFVKWAPFHWISLLSSSVKAVKGIFGKNHKILIILQIVTWDMACQDQELHLAGWLILLPLLYQREFMSSACVEMTKRDELNFGRSAGKNE